MKDIERIIATVYVNDMVEILGIVEILVVEKRLVRTVVIHSEIQDVESLLSLVQ